MARWACAFFTTWSRNCSIAELQQYTGVSASHWYAGHQWALAAMALQASLSARLEACGNWWCGSSVISCPLLQGGAASRGQHGQPGQSVGLRPAHRAGCLCTGCRHGCSQQAGTSCGRASGGTPPWTPAAAWPSAHSSGQLAHLCVGACTHCMAPEVCVSSVLCAHMVTALLCINMVAPTCLPSE